MKEERKDIILLEIGKLTLCNNSNLKLLQMSAIITWMILEKFLDVGRQYFFIGFLFWHSICEEMCHKILIKGGQKIHFL